MKNSPGDNNNNNNNENQRKRKEKRDKYLDLVRKLKKVWNMIGVLGMIPKGLVRGL